MKNKHLLMLIESVLFAVIALLMDIFIPRISWGINISFEMLPIFIVAFRWGVLPGMSSGLLWGVLQIITGQAAGGIVNPLQGFLEYILAFAVIGLAGFFANAIQVELAKNDNKKLWKVTSYSILGMIIGAFVKYFIHFVAGVIYWGQYAPEGQTAFYYSFITNGGSFLSEIITCIVVFIILIPFYNLIIYNKNYQLKK